ncbi:tellurium resistance protein TerC [Prevotella pallens]|uniref:tellurium resistance protein TerC n=1 Tax=Prevotella pallens TaxID=60133 RepID=UPI003C7BC76A
MLVWGGLVLSTSLIIWLLITNTPKGEGGGRWHLLWILMSLIGGIYQYYFNRSWSVPDTIVSRTIGYMWGVFGISVFVLWAINICAITFGGISVRQIIPMTPTIILFMGLSVAVTGLVINRLFISVIGAVACAICSYFSLVNQGVNELLCIAVTAVFTLLVPGLYLKFSNGR